VEVVTFSAFYSCNQCSNSKKNDKEIDFKHGIVKDSAQKNQQFEKYFSAFYKAKSFNGCALVSQKGQIIFEKYLALIQIAFTKVEINNLG